MIARRASALGGVVLGLAACKHAATDPNDAGAAFTAIASDEGVYFSVEGPKSASYVLPHASFDADTKGHAGFGVPTQNLPPSNALDVLVRWEDAEAIREQRVSVPFAFTAPVPHVAFVAHGNPLAASAPALEVTCGGACSGKAVFYDGLTSISVEGSAVGGCTVRIGSRSHTWNELPSWDDHGKSHRAPVDIGADVGDVVAKAKLPDALTSNVELTASLECPGRAKESWVLSFPSGAAVTWVRGHYHAIANGLPWAASARRRNVVVLHGAQFLEELDLATELVRFYGTPTVADDVDLVGKILEVPRDDDAICGSGRATILVERRNFDLQIYDAAGKVVAKTVLVAPAPDCKRLASEPAKPDEKGVDHRIVRPSEAAIAAFVKPLLRP